MASALHDPLLLALRVELPLGRERPVSGRVLAACLGISYRGVQEGIASIIEDYEVPVGSICSGPRTGFFIMRPGDEADFTAGTSHTVHRGAAMFRRIRALERIRQRRYPHTPRLFGEDVGAA
jgi:hypothetical protein